MKALLKFTLAALVLAAMPAIAEIGPEYGTKIEISCADKDFKVDPAISPNGNWVAFITGLNIWIISSAGGDGKLMYSGSINNKPNVGCSITSLRFTPDSQEITFIEDIDTLKVSGTQAAIASSKTTLKAVNIETKNVRVVLDNANMVHFTSDGKYISYVNNDPNAYVDITQADHNGVMTIYNIQTGEKRFLTDENLAPSALKYGYPAISPDMKWVYFNLMNTVQNFTQGQLYRMPFEGGNMEQLTFYKDVKSAHCRNINFSPDGKWLLFDYCFDIVVFNIELKKTFKAFLGTETDSPNIYPNNDTGWEACPSLMTGNTIFVYSIMKGGRSIENTYSFDIYTCNLNIAKYAYIHPSLVESENPESFAMLTNYPNPFNPSTTIEFNLIKPETVNLSVYNLTGQKVCELASGNMGIGKHSYIWNGRDSKGTPVSSGIFFTRLETKDNIISNRMMLVK